MYTSLQLNDDLMVETFAFSDFITCIEVFFNGKSYSSFCSLKEQVEEWKENPDELIQLCIQHIKNQTRNSN